LANALKPAVLPGEKMTVRIIKRGEDPGQGVGYLDDGTMVVVEQGAGHVDQEVEFTVTNTRQTSAGKMIFGRMGDAPPAKPFSPPPAEARQAARVGHLNLRLRAAFRRHSPRRRFLDSLWRTPQQAGGNARRLAGHHARGAALRAAIRYTSDPDRRPE